MFKKNSYFVIIKVKVELFLLHILFSMKSSTATATATTDTYVRYSNDNSGMPYESFLKYVCKPTNGCEISSSRHQPTAISYQAKQQQPQHFVLLLCDSYIRSVSPQIDSLHI